MVDVMEELLWVFAELKVYVLSSLHADFGERFLACPNKVHIFLGVLNEILEVCPEMHVNLLQGKTHS